MSETAENFLIEQGIVRKPSHQRREALGCIACRWNDTPADSDPKVYGYQIMKCRGIQSGTLYPMLKAMANGGLIDPHDVIIDKPKQGRLGGPVRKIYTPADTELGTAFRATLEQPSDCNLGEQERMLADLQESENR
jgi:hypothetical protein